MRILIAIPALLALGACNVSKEGNAVTVQYDQIGSYPALATDRISTVRQFTRPGGGSAREMPTTRRWTG